MKRQRYQQMNPLSDMLPLLEVSSGLHLELLEVYLRGTIHLDFSHHCSAAFFSAPFMMHNTNNRMQSLTIGSIHGWMRMCEREGPVGAEAGSMGRKAPPSEPTCQHWTAAWVLLQPYHGQVGNLFSWVCPSYHLTF